MAKRFTFEEDQTIFRYDYLCAADLGRTEDAVKARISKLKATGAWKAFEMIDYLEAVCQRIMRRPLEADGVMPNDMRYELSLALINEIHPIMQKHSDKFSDEEHYIAFGER